MLEEFFPLTVGDDMEQFDEPQPLNIMDVDEEDVAKIIEDVKGELDALIEKFEQAYKQQELKHVATQLAKVKL